MKKILIVEDDQFLVDSYMNAFDKDSYEIKVARNGEEASWMIEASKPDLIILDIIMPRKSGLDLLEEIKKNEAQMNIPIIAVSNVSDMDVINKVEELGVNEFVIKSDISIDGLIELSRKYV